MATITMIYELDKLTKDSLGSEIQIIEKPLAIQEIDGSGVGSASATLNTGARYVAVMPLNSNGWFAFATTVGGIIAGSRFATVQGVPFFVRIPPGATKIAVLDR